MRDFSADLRDRSHLLAQQISAENGRFETLVSQLKLEQASRLEHLRAQLRLANKLLEFVVWQAHVRAALAARIAVAEAAEVSIKKSFLAVEHVGSS